jgi:hypothetical protein
MFNDLDADSLDLWKVSNPGQQIRRFHADDLIFERSISTSRRTQISSIRSR